MKNRGFIVLTLLMLALLCGCAAGRVSASGNAVQASTGPAGASGAALTDQDAQRIALDHAGFTPDEVTYLHARYELDDGVPQYEVGFHKDRWEYDYEIDARTGEILSYDRED